WRDQLSAIVVLRDVVDGGCAAESMHYAEADRVVVEHRREHAAHGAFLAPNFAANRLLIPEVASIGSGYSAGIFGGVSPCRAALQRASLVNDPFPRDVALLTGQPKQAIDPLHLVVSHRGDEPGDEQLVADTATSDGLRGFGSGVHRLDEPRHP